MRLVRGPGPAEQSAGPGLRDRRRLLVPLALVAVVSVALAWVLATIETGDGPFGTGGDRGSAAATGAPTDAPTAGNGSGGTPLPAGTDLASRFLDEYVDPDGRVVRRDQGGDTVSEGQAYALLLAAADGDEQTFDRVWDWTTENLARPDGLLSWTWRDGAVVDANSASDADVDAAHALVLAGKAFDRPDLTEDGTALATAVLQHETRDTPLGRVLVAGQWATTEPYQVNPSYSSPTAYALLGRETGDARWDELAAGDRAVVTSLLDRAPLPPDWAQIKADGSVEPMPPPGGGAVAHGLDAQRIALRYSASCDAVDREVATRIGRSVTTTAADVRGVYDLGGTAQVPWQHPLALVSAAAVTAASDDRPDTESLLDAAAALDGRSSTYYGAAWAALGERFLEEPGSLGIDCSTEENR